MKIFVKISIATLILGIGFFALWFYFRVPENDFTYQARHVLKSADSFELFSLHPYRNPSEDISKLESFHDYVVLGRTEIKSQKLRDELLTALEKGVATKERVYASCYWPRHGIRAQLARQTVDLQICFECGYVYIFTDGKTRCIHTDRTPLAKFNQVLTDRGIPMIQE